MVQGFRVINRFRRSTSRNIRAGVRFKAGKTLKPLLKKIDLTRL
jgi:hypothetical protein